MLEFRRDWRLCMIVYLEVMGAQGSLGGSPSERTYKNMVRGSRARHDLRRPGQRTRDALWREILTPEYAFISRHKFNCVDVRNIFTLAILSCAR